MDYSPPINDGFPILIWQPQATGIGDLVTESNIILYHNPTSGELWISDVRCAT
ncbi:MAG: hypothetical protein FWG84_03755 [Bacteroidales bacterium]|nr:hypothetical protein [Bacteroidales bacterium]